MKKLSLLLLAVCASVMSWAQNNSTAGLAYTLNPYAYDLSIKSWDPATRQLTVQFKLNAPPNLDDNGTDNNGPYNEGIADKEPNGIQIYAVDQSGNEYRIGGLGRPDIQKGINDGQFDYTINLSAGTTVEFNGGTPRPLPLDEPLTWKVRVKGRSNNTEAYQKPRHITVRPSGHKRPRYTLGVDVGNKPLSPNFGKIFITEVSDGSKNLVDNTSLQGHATWGWLYDALYDANYTVDGGGHKRMPALLEYTPQLLYKTLHKKYKHDGADSWFSGTPYYEPHRVRVSDDGRIFVTSHHTNAGAAVMEYKGNNQFITIIDFDRTNVVAGTNAKFNRRVVSMDVKGSGPDLKILVAWIDADAATKNGKICAQIQCWEYPIGTSESKHTHNSGTKIAEFNDLTYTSGSGTNDGTGLLYRGYLNTWNGGNLGFVEVAYGNGNNNPVWLKIDYSYGTVAPGQLLYFENGALKYTNTMNSSYHYNSYYGGNSLLIKGDTLITTGGQRLQLYKIGSNGQLSELPNPITSTEFGAWTNGLALDYANNLYGVSEYTGRLITVALPYSGVVETPAPTNSTFTIAKPVPNILATDLRLEINNANEYTFSFNTNTKPEYAELRFYKSYDSMKQSLNAVNADNFKGNETTGRDNENLVCYYPITTGLKQGKITVTLGGVGGIVENKRITNSKLPAGELYWSVYVQTRESKVFAPIYQYGATTDATNGHHRKHIAVNNYPETDMFGSLIVAHNPSVTDDATRANRGLHIYGLNPEGNSIDEQDNINNTTRYSKRAEYLNQNADGSLHYPRRLAVGPDGKVYVADEGSETASRTTQGAVIHEHGGVKLWDPTNPNKFALFSDNKIGTATGVALYEHSDGWKLYANNTYNEFASHGNAYTKENQDNPASYGWNGFVGYVLDKYTSGHNGSWSSWGNNATEVALRRGDASGNFAFAAMDKGLWICQYREHTVNIKTSIQQPLADNFEAYILSFVPYGGDVRKWTSSEGIGVKSYNKTTGEPVWDDNISPYSQTTTAPLQSTPGGGVAYKKINGKEYVYVVNHDGNIAVLEITGWTGTGVSSTPIIPVANIKILTTPEFTKGDRDVSGTSTKWHTAYITSMCFDYAGNLVTTTGKGYHDGPQDILVYTMPYDRVNAREIQAPNSCRMIPERLAYLDMSAGEMELIINNHKDHDGCAIELFRPLQAGMFNTICLPFELDFANLPNEHPFKDAEVRAFTGATLEDVGGEKVLSLVFSDITKGEQKVMGANTPYLLQPVADIVGSVRFDYPVQLTSTVGGSVGRDYDNDQNNDINFQGVIPITPLEATYSTDGTNTPLTLLLVADNRLAALTSNTNMLGFRAYFQLAKPLPPGTAAKIVGKKPVTTNTTIVVDGKKVNVDKFLREGRVYIRVGETLYTITGEVVGR